MTLVGKPRKVDSPKKKEVEKPRDGRQKSGKNIGNPYQMEDNKNTKGATPKAPPRCLPFGKDFLCFCITSRANSSLILGQLSLMFRGKAWKNDIVISHD